MAFPADPADGLGRRPLGLVRCRLRGGTHAGAEPRGSPGRVPRRRALVGAGPRRRPVAARSARRSAALLAVRAALQPGALRRPGRLPAHRARARGDPGGAVALQGHAHGRPGRLRSPGGGQREGPGRRRRRRWKPGGRPLRRHRVRPRPMPPGGGGPRGADSGRDAGVRAARDRLRPRAWAADAGTRGSGRAGPGSAGGRAVVSRDRFTRAGRVRRLVGSLRRGRARSRHPARFQRSVPHRRGGRRSDVHRPAGGEPAQRHARADDGARARRGRRGDRRPAAATGGGQARRRAPAGRLRPAPAAGGTRRARSG